MHPQGGQLRRHEAFQSQFLVHPRDVVVWLPPGYDEGPAPASTAPVDDESRRYPVLYMHDGQNLFEPDTAFQKGEHWRMGETAQELIASGEIDRCRLGHVY